MSTPSRWRPYLCRDCKKPHCYWCGIEVRFKRLRTENGKIPDDIATKDHLIPKSLGGSNDSSNIVIACYACNQFRGNNIAGLKPFHYNRFRSLGL